MRFGRTLPLTIATGQRQPGHLRDPRRRRQEEGEVRGVLQLDGGRVRLAGRAQGQDKGLGGEEAARHSRVMETANLICETFVMGAAEVEVMRYSVYLH